MSSGRSIDLLGLSDDTKLPYPGRIFSLGDQEGDEMSLETGASSNPTDPVQITFYSNDSQAPGYEGVTSDTKLYHPSTSGHMNIAIERKGSPQSAGSSCGDNIEDPSSIYMSSKMTRMDYWKQEASKSMKRIKQMEDEDPESHAAVAAYLNERQAADRTLDDPYGDNSSADMTEHGTFLASVSAAMKEDKVIVPTALEDELTANGLNELVRLPGREALSREMRKIEEQHTAEAISFRDKWTAEDHQVSAAIRRKNVFSAISRSGVPNFSTSSSGRAEDRDAIISARNYQDLVIYETKEKMESEVQRRIEEGKSVAEAVKTRWEDQLQKVHEMGYTVLRDL